MTTIECIPLKRLKPAEFLPRLEHRIIKAAVTFAPPPELAAMLAEHWRLKGLWVAEDPTEVVYTGWRHSDIIMHIHALGKGYTKQEDQGFVCNQGAFHDRRMSFKIAAGARQLASGLTHVHDLMSEEVWAKDGTPRTPGMPYHHCS